MECQGFQNIELVSHYSKSVNRKNPKWLDFALVQVTTVVKRRHNLSFMPHKIKNDSYSTKWNTKSFQNILLVSYYSKSVSRKNSKCLDFVLVQVTPIVQKRHNFSFMPHKIKNDSYSTKWNTKSFQNILLVSHYSKSVSRKNSKCLDFVLVQVTPIVKKGRISLPCCTKSKNDCYSTKWHAKGFQNIELVSHYSKSVNRKNPKCLDFALVQVTTVVKRRHNLSFMPHKIKNDSYSTKWNTESFQNILLVSYYSKSVSRKNSKCLDFVLVQVTPIVQKRHNFSFMPHKKNDSCSTKWHTNRYKGKTQRNRYQDLQRRLPFAFKPLSVPLIAPLHAQRIAD